MLNNRDREYAYVLDSRHRFCGMVSIDSLRDLLDQENGTKRKIEEAFIRDALAVQETECLQDILPQVASHKWPVPVINEEGIFKGVVSKNRFLKTLYRAETESSPL
jgi:glycine betaine/proline transport system ATP-binding protein